MASARRLDDLLEVFERLLETHGQVESFVQDAEKLVVALARKHSAADVHSVRALSNTRWKAPTFVYLAESSCGMYVKIGASSNPDTRMRGMLSYDGKWNVIVPADIGTGVPRAVCVFRGGYELEKKLHDAFTHARAAGEWFDLTDAQVSDFVQEHRGTYEDLAEGAAYHRLYRGGSVST